LRIAVDYAPFEGAGRVEDTVNLLAQATRNLLGLCCFWLDRTRSEIAKSLDLHLVTGSSVKATMDIDWSDDSARMEGVGKLYDEAQTVVQFARESGVVELGVESEASSLVIKQIISQNLVLADAVRIRRDVAKDRRISIEDSDMRHGRKSSSSRVNGYKRHLTLDLDSQIVLHCGVAKADVHDSDHMEDVRAAIESAG
jgi:hypothetical protein